MQYLEDILELIEDLPEEIANRFDKIRKLDKETKDHMEVFNGLRNRLLDKSLKLAEEEKRQLCLEIGERYHKMRKLGEQKLELAERTERLMTNVSDKVNESAYHCKIELEVDSCGSTEIIERNFCASRRLRPAEMRDCQMKFEPIEPSPLFSDVDMMLPSSRPGRPLREQNKYYPGTLGRKNAKKGAAVKRKQDKTSSIRGRGRPPRNDPLDLASICADMDDASSRASSTKEDDPFSLLDFGSSAVGSDEDLTDFADIFPQMPSPPREILDIMKDDSPTVFSLDLGLGSLTSPSASPRISIKLDPSPTPSGLRSRENSMSRTSAPSSAGFFDKEKERKKKQLFSAGPDVSMHGRPRKLTTRVEELISEKREKERKKVNREDDGVVQSVISAGILDGSSLKEEEEDEDNATVWCVCKKPSAGEMIYCDNDGKCRIQWFHFECLGLKEAPAGLWYCPECRSNMQREGR